MLPPKYWVVALLVLASVLVTSSAAATGEEEKEDEVATPVAEALVADNFNNTSVVRSPAEELLMAAKAAGYELTLDKLDQAAAATDEEVGELMPPPVAEAFISHRRRDNMDLIREQMIGMIFTGKPEPLGSRPRPTFLHPGQPPRHPSPPLRHPQALPRHPLPQPAAPARRNPYNRFQVQYNPQGEASFQSNRKVPSPQEILKPLPFEPGPTTVKFPPHRAAPAPPRQSPGFPAPGEDFTNTVGPDFGPVTFTEFGGNFGFQNNFENEFGEFNLSPSRPSRPPPPGSRPPPPVSRPPHSVSRPHPPSARPRPSPPRPAHRPARPPTRQGGFSTGGFVGIRGDGCVKYTEDICLDTDKYPHEAILSSLVRDPSRADSMVAEVRSQSADDLVDGVSAAQEEKYDYQHYFGNRRAGTENHAHRDFAQDGGFLCPSEVKYARPKRARNSKGDWKFIVNMDKYSQTIRMEKCLKPGGACSYVSHHYRATCNQVYNYHRLLSWEDGRGLHMDIFKVPSCCSCHIQGYAYIFPPLNRHQNAASSALHPRTAPGPSPPQDHPNATAPAGSTRAARGS